MQVSLSVANIPNLMWQTRLIADESRQTKKNAPEYSEAFGINFINLRLEVFGR
jgi:hypothetical protein